MEDKRVFYLNSDEWEKFVEILEAPAQPSDRLRELMNMPEPWDKNDQQAYEAFESTLEKRSELYKRLAQSD